MATPETLPPAFDPSQETDKFLAGCKKKASTKFSRKKAASLEAATRLAYWLYVYGKEDQALEVCRFLGEYEFAGNFSIWTWIEILLALQSRIVRAQGQNGESTECVRRIRSAGFSESRLTGNLLNDLLERIKRAVEEKDKTSERDWALGALFELCVLIELGGSETWPVDALEREFQGNVARLKVLQKVS